MNSTFPIVKIDRTTITELLPVFINKGIFSNYDDLPERADLLNQYKEDLVFHRTLTKEQEREFYLRLESIKLISMWSVIMVIT